MKYFKDEINNVYMDPIVENHIGLQEITVDEFYSFLAPTEAELTSQAEAKFISKIDDFIQKEVDSLNSLKGVKYSDIHNCKSFAMTTGYEFKDECLALTNWAFITVWGNMRAWQKTLTTIPTDAEFQAELAKIPFNA